MHTKAKLPTLLYSTKRTTYDLQFNRAVRIRYLHECPLCLSFIIIRPLAIDDPHIGSHAPMLSAQSQIRAFPCAQPLLTRGAKLRQQRLRNLKRGVDDVSFLERIVRAGYCEEVVGLNVCWDWWVD